MLEHKEFQDLIGWKPHKTQKEVLGAFDSGIREIVINAGRRWGKSALCGYLVAKTFIDLFQEYREGKRGSVKIWVVAPTYELAKKVFSYIVLFLRKAEPQILAHVKSRPIPMIELDINCWIQCKSADSPKGLLGEELDLLIIDEAANLSQGIWADYLLPTVVDARKKGKTVFISTPRGKNWFYELYMRAKEKGGAFHFTSLEGVSVDQEGWERAKAETSADYFQQNFEATFLETASSVFRKVRECIDTTCLSKPVVGRSYVMGLDLAKIGDYTAIAIIDKTTHKNVYLDRFHKISYPLQIERIERAAKDYGNALIVVDVGNVGVAVSDELHAKGCRVMDFKIVGTISKDFNKRGSKEKVINKLQVDLEHKNIWIPAHEILINELEAYSYNMSPAGNYKYGAPEGMHDDYVIALALANWMLRGKTREKSFQAQKSTPNRRKIFEYI